MADYRLRANVPLSSNRQLELHEGQWKMRERPPGDPNVENLKYWGKAAKNIYNAYVVEPLRMIQRVGAEGLKGLGIETNEEPPSPLDYTFSVLAGITGGIPGGGPKGPAVAGQIRGVTPATARMLRKEMQREMTLRGPSPYRGTGPRGTAAAEEMVGRLMEYVGPASEGSWWWKVPVERTKTISDILRGTWFHGRRTHPPYENIEQSWNTPELYNYSQARQRKLNLGEPVGISLAMDPQVSSSHYFTGPAGTVHRVFPRFGGPPEQKVLIGWAEESGEALKKAYIEAARRIVPEAKLHMSDLRYELEGDINRFNRYLTENLQEQGYEGILYHPMRGGYGEYELKMFDPGRVLSLDERTMADVATKRLFQSPFVTEKSAGKIVTSAKKPSISTVDFPIRSPKGKQAQRDKWKEITAGSPKISLRNYWEEMNIRDFYGKEELKKVAEDAMSWAEKTQNTAYNPSAAILYKNYVKNGFSSDDAYALAQTQVYDSIPHDASEEIQKAYKLLPPDSKLQAHQVFFGPKPKIAYTVKVLGGHFIHQSDSPIKAAEKAVTFLEEKALKKKFNETLNQAMTLGSDIEMTPKKLAFKVEQHLANSGLFTPISAKHVAATQVWGEIPQAKDWLNKQSEILGVPTPTLSAYPHLKGGKADILYVVKGTDLFKLTKGSGFTPIKAFMDYAKKVKHKPEAQLKKQTWKAPGSTWESLNESLIEIKTNPSLGHEDKLGAFKDAYWNSGHFGLKKSSQLAQTQVYGHLLPTSPYNKSAYAMLDEAAKPYKYDLGAYAHKNPEGKIEMVYYLDDGDGNQISGAYGSVKELVDDVFSQEKWGKEPK